MSHLKTFETSATMLLLSSACAAGYADTITFDELGAQPCSFLETGPLTNEYAAQGVTFAGPQQGQGGAILDQCVGYNINARSGSDFLAFDIFNSYATLPETVYFDSGASHVECYATSPQNGAFILTAYDADNNVVDTANVTIFSGRWKYVEVNGPIDHVMMSSISFLVAVDDLSWTVAGDYQLDLVGQCPGRVTVSWTGATPGRQQGLVFGANQGNTTIPNGACRGTVLGVQGQVRLVNTFSTGNGGGSVSGDAGAASCGHYLQLIESGSCTTSNVKQIPQ